MQKESTGMFTGDISGSAFTRALKSRSAPVLGSEGDWIIDETILVDAEKA